MRDDLRPGRPARKVAALIGVVALGALTACSEQGARLGLPVAATVEGKAVGDLWLGAWIASFAIGGIVWGLIGWSVVRYRRREGDRPAPRQTKYHLPLELLYTLVPFLIIGVLFFYAVQAQDTVTKKHAEPDVVVNVIGQKWSWTFNYMEADNPDIGVDAHAVGTLEEIPDLYLPVNSKVRFNLQSPDVIHSFWVPSFRRKLDVIPGNPNVMDVTTDTIGVYDGKCAELCGTYHSLMLFKVHVVDEETYNAYVKDLAENGGEGEVKLPASAADTIPTTEAEEENP